MTSPTYEPRHQTGGERVGAKTLDGGRAGRGREIRYQAVAVLTGSGQDISSLKAAQMKFVTRMQRQEV